MILYHTIILDDLFLSLFSRYNLVVSFRFERRKWERQKQKQEEDLTRIIFDREHEKKKENEPPANSNEAYYYT